MEEMIVSSVIQWIGDSLIQEGKLLFGVKDEVEGLQGVLVLMQQYLQDADTRQQEAEIVALINQVRKLVFEAEDVIDTYILKLEPKSQHNHRKIPSKYAHLLYNTAHSYRVGKQIQKIMKKLKQNTNNFITFGVRRNPGFGLTGDGRRWKEMRGQQTYGYDDGNYVVGWEKDASKLVQVLVDENMNRISFLCIVGMGGSGKTTLARKLYNDMDVVRCFECRAWVYVSQEWNTVEILSRILRQVGGSKEVENTITTVGDVVHELREILEKKSYLVVLDDIWRRRTLEDILPALPRGNTINGSKIIITTRNQEVIQFLDPQPNQYIVEPPPLTDEEAWELFNRIMVSHLSNKNNKKSFEELGKQMLKKCDGLPLAIVTLSGILRRKHNISEWERVNETVRLRVMKSTATHKYGRVGDLLALSYDDLPPYLKSCFLYLAIFPEDCQIPTGMLARMWIAEGLVTTHEQMGMSVEDVATQRLEELSHRFLVQIARINFKGEIKAIRLHDLLRDLSIQKAREQGFSAIYTQINCSYPCDVPQFSIEPRRAALHSSVTLPTQASHLRSLTMLTTSSISPSAYVSKEKIDLGVVCKNFKLLRLMNLWGVQTYNGTLPVHIGSLIHLRYLGIRASNVIELPTSIGNLRNLLTLDYRDVESDTNEVTIKIPASLGNLVRLRHLFLPINHLWDIEDLRVQGMRNLQTLWGVKQGGVSNWLSTQLEHLSNTIKKLKIIMSSTEEILKTFYWLSLTSNGLHSLHCEMRKGLVLQQVESISNHKQLQKLVIMGEIKMKLAHILPSKLVELELKDSAILEEDPMTVIGELQHLKLLKLLNSYFGAKFTCNRNSFPCLEELYLGKLENLWQWKIDSGSLLCLKKLELSYCPRLKHFPQDLLNVTMLQELNYMGMAEEFEQSASKMWGRRGFIPPRNYKAILQHCDSLLDTSSITKIYEQLSTGVFFRDESTKYWVIKREDVYFNCFMLYAAFLSLHGGHGKMENVAERYSTRGNMDKFTKKLPKLERLY